MSVPRLVVLTERHLLPDGIDLVDHLARCAVAGLTHVLLRELDLPDADRARLVDRLRSTGLSVWSAHRPLAGADGVHLPDPSGPHQPSGPHHPSGAHHRSGLASTLRWGRSCHSRAQAAAAAEAGASWATLSPVADSASKPGRSPIDWDSLAGNAIPVLALGGVDEQNARALRAAGAHGVAVMGAVMRPRDPGVVVRALLEAIR